MNKTALKKDALEIHTLDGKDPVIDKIEHGLVNFNSKHLGAPYKSRVVAAYRGDEFIGGIFFRWYTRHASIQKVWVEEKSRRQGIGKKLLATAEIELHRQGCRRIHVDTVSFQAPDFYQKNGYQLIATVPDYLENADKLFFVKNLSEVMSDE